MEELEKKRILYKNLVIKVLLCGLIIILLAFLLLSKGIIGNIIFIFVIFAVIVSSIVIPQKKRLEYVAVYKNYFVNKSLEKKFTDLEYNYQTGLDRSVIASTNMMNMGDRYSSNDYIKGRYKNIGFEQSDVHIEEEYEYTDSDGNTHTSYVTIFMGRWMIFDFNKRFKSNFQVCQKGFGNNKVNTLFSKEKFHKVELESVEFNKLFKVYTKDDHDVFYVLTPSIIEKIENLTHKIKGKMLFCFVDNKLHVGINNDKDSFEPKSAFSKIDEDKILNEINSDINVITTFIDDLDLNNDIFIMED